MRPEVYQPLLPNEPAGRSRSGGGPAAARATAARQGGRVISRVLAAGALAAVLVLQPAPAAAAPAWAWPVPLPHPVVRGFVAPEHPWSAGHRGIDVSAAVGSPVTAPADGVVVFAGRVVDRGVLSIDHGGVVSSLEPVEPLVATGASVTRGEVVARVATGGTHPAGILHIGARIDGGYVSPLLFLGGLRRAVLLPLATLP